VAQEKAVGGFPARQTPNSMASRFLPALSSLAARQEKSIDHALLLGKLFL
jgi:hypothetical protein